MSLSSKCRRVLQLSRVKGLGLKRFHQLLEEAGSLDALLSNDPESLSSTLRADVLCRVRQCLGGQLSDDAQCYQDKTHAWLEAKPNRYVVCMDDADYPELLKQIYCPPPLLYIEGCLAAIQADSLAVVGSRKPTMAGARHAHNLTAELSQAGLVINSGLALGIDAVAHRAALSVGGLSVGVMATGLDRIYPKQHLALAGELIEQGVLLTEMPLGTLPHPGNFPRRNRIISGLSSGVLVIEAGLKSGSLVTARYALEQNRDVYAVPGAIDSLASQGCNSLIKEGAALVESVADILPFFQSYTSEPQNAAHPPQDVELNEGELRICSAMTQGCLAFDSLQAFTGLATARLLEHILSLELKQVIAPVPGGYELMKPVNLPA